MGGGISQSAIVNQLNIMVATVITNISSYCNSNNISNQAINLECSPGNYLVEDMVFEQNEACNQCMQTQVYNANQFLTFQANLWDKSAPSVQGSIDSWFQQYINQFIICGQTACKACVIQNVAQNTIIQSVLGCQAFNQVQNEISQQLMDQVTQQLTNNQDMLSPLAEMLGASSTADIIANVTNRMSSLLTETVISNIQQQIDSVQTLNYEVGNFKINGNTQQVAFNQVVNYLSQTNIMNQVLQQTDWTTLEHLINNQNTINTLGNVVVQSVSTISKMLTNIVGQVIVFVFIVMAVVFTIVIFYVIAKLIQKYVKKNKATEESSEKPRDKF